MPTAATRAKKSTQPQQLTVGSHVFHRAHGVAEVVGIESRTVGEERPRFYILELVSGGRVLLPVHNVEASALRRLISAAHARKLLKQVEKEPELEGTPWKQRADLFAATLRNGDADGYTEILRQLLFRSRARKLNMTEQRLLEAARSYFASEIGIVLGRTAQQIERRLLALTERGKDTP